MSVSGTRTLAVAGSTGSIGRQALEVAAARPERLRVVGLAAGRDLDRLCEQARRIRPGMVALEHAPDEVRARAELAAAAPGAEVVVGRGAAARLRWCSTAWSGRPAFQSRSRPSSGARASPSPTRSPWWSGGRW